jgi:hypothetical protein
MLKDTKGIIRSHQTIHMAQIYQRDNQKSYNDELSKDVKTPDR